MRLYISGPMSIVGPPTWNFPAFDAAEKELLAAGFEVENPATKGLIDGWTWHQYLKYDLKKLLDCDGIALLDGWRKSRGARLEVQVAGGLDIPYMKVASWLVGT